jgi:hypothetical protein
MSWSDMPSSQHLVACRFACPFSGRFVTRGGGDERSGGAGGSVNEVGSVRGVAGAEMRVTSRPEPEGPCGGPGASGSERASPSRGPGERRRVGCGAVEWSSHHAPGRTDSERSGRGGGASAGPRGRLRLLVRARRGEARAVPARARSGRRLGRIGRARARTRGSSSGARIGRGGILGAGDARGRDRRDRTRHGGAVGRSSNHRDRTSINTRDPRRRAAVGARGHSRPEAKGRRAERP